MSFDVKARCSSTCLLGIPVFQNGIRCAVKRNTSSILPPHPTGAWRIHNCAAIGICATGPGRVQHGTARPDCPGRSHLCEDLRIRHRQYRSCGRRPLRHEGKSLGRILGRQEPALTACRAILLGDTSGCRAEALSSDSRCMRWRRSRCHLNDSQSYCCDPMTEIESRQTGAP